VTLKEILADPSISSWLKDAIKTAYEQDPVDALRDCHRLLKMLGERYTQIVNRDLAQRPVRLVSGVCFSADWGGRGSIKTSAGNRLGFFEQDANRYRTVRVQTCEITFCRPAGLG
jgi:hypothetical protein